MHLYQLSQQLKTTPNSQQSFLRKPCHYEAGWWQHGVVGKLFFISSDLKTVQGWKQVGWSWRKKKIRDLILGQSFTFKHHNNTKITAKAPQERFKSKNLSMLQSKPRTQSCGKYPILFTKSDLHSIWTWTWAILPRGMPQLVGNLCTNFVMPPTSCRIEGYYGTWWLTGAAANQVREKMCKRVRV